MNMNMKAAMRFALIVSFICGAIVLAGCGAAKENGQDQDNGGGQGGQHAQGPHGGHVIELGHEHLFHAELVEDEENELVSVYILDGDIKELPIAESSITLILTHDGVSETYELAAVGAVEGKTARFDAADKRLHAEMEAHHDVEVKLRVTINGSQHTGHFQHAHAHSDARE